MAGSATLDVLEDVINILLDKGLGAEKRGLTDGCAYGGSCRVVAFEFSRVEMGWLVGWSMRPMRGGGLISESCGNLQMSIGSYSSS